MTVANYALPVFEIEQARYRLPRPPMWGYGVGRRSGGGRQAALFGANRLSGSLIRFILLVDATSFSKLLHPV